MITERVRIDQDYAERVYSGVLGKIIGVYLGRPVEGWSYPLIRERFGEIGYYVNRELNVPLIVADDDISGTFGFFRTLEDHPSIDDISARDFGNTWLNYIIENKTILWWGGLGRSTEHTAYIRLKNGVSAPESGSALTNGRTLSEQIGAQIFIDAIAMTCPGDPERAIRLVRESASVSHDGLAVDAACFLGALESLAFTESSIEKLLDAGTKFVENNTLLKLIESVVDICSTNNDWREVRDRLEDSYGYDKFHGTCPMETNHAALLASLLLARDDFHKSVMIASSMGWDTDCNAGNIGCLNGIRLGLPSLSARVDLRTAVADRMLVVTSDSGSCITDAVQESRKIVRVAKKLYAAGSGASSGKKFTFEFPGSLQGFTICPHSNHGVRAHSFVVNKEFRPGERALCIGLRNCGSFTPCDISTPTHVDPLELSKNFATFSSPTLYPTQNVEAVITTSIRGLHVRPYVLAYDEKNQVQRYGGKTIFLEGGENTIPFHVPETGGMPIIRLGYSFFSDSNVDGDVWLNSVDWGGAPARYEQKGVSMASIWDINPGWMTAWASSARHFAPDVTYTYCISHDDDGGLVTQGTRDWTDYSIDTSLVFNLHKRGGLVIRSVGHRRCYACLFHGGRRVSIIRRQDNTETTIADTEFVYQENIPYRVRFSALKTRLSVAIDNTELLSADDRVFHCGAGGFMVERGTLLADGFVVQRLPA